MTSTINASTTAGIVTTADTSGVLALQTAGTTAVTVDASQNTTLAGALAVNGNTTLGDASTDTILMTGAPSIGGAGLGMGMGFRNRIINGAMAIDQRNAGASVTPTNGAYTLDRWSATLTQASKFTVEQTITGVSAPVGFTDYLAVTSSSAYTVLTGDAFGISQAIEGLNTADLAWGTASAATVTLSFWVRSSLTGTFGGQVYNSSANRSYVFSYSISSANTWEQKAVTIAGDTTGTWLTTNGVGAIVRFGLGSGSTFTNTAGSWYAGNFVQPTGSVSVVGTNGATFYITGVQLEKGSTATSFDYRPYGTELQLCQRYYFKNIPAVAGSNVATGVFNGTTNLVITPILPVPMRVAPTMTQLTMSVANGVTANAVTSIGTQTFGVNSGLVVMNGTSASYATGQAGYLFTQATSSFVDFTAEI